MRKRYLSGVALSLCLMVMSMLACGKENMAIEGVLRYTCPSSTPKPTNTQPPPNPPYYPSAFMANLDYAYVDVTRSVVIVQYLAQSVGVVQLTYSGYSDSGLAWSGSTFIGAAPYGSPGFAAVYGIYIPTNVNSATLAVSAGGYTYTLTVIRYAYAFSAIPNPYPCCLPAPIYPTPRPTYTPYPTPTLFQIEQPEAFYLDDAVFNYVGPILLKLRMKSPIQYGQLRLIIPLFAASSWTIEITNLGSVEYAFLGAGYTFVTEVRHDSGTLERSVWPPSHLAAQFLGIIEQAYGPKIVKPGQPITVTVAAWIPADSVPTRVSLVADPYNHGDPGWATFVPGSIPEQRMINWKNETNPYCRGEIIYQ